jgi:hypothetical protein
MPRLTQLPQYQDGDYSVARRISRSPRAYPFAQNGDVTTYTYTATYMVHIDRFVPTPRGTVDPEHAGVYLLDESIPQITQGSIATFTRTYGTIPLHQEQPSSISLTKPSLSGDFPQPFGPYRIFQPDLSLLRYDVYTAQTVTGDSGVPALYPTGGTYTLAFLGETTSSLAFDADAAAVADALNALGSVTAFGGVTVTGAYNAGGFSVVFAGAPLATYNVGSLSILLFCSRISSLTRSPDGFTQYFSFRAVAGDPLPAASADTSSLEGSTEDVTFDVAVTFGNASHRSQHIAIVAHHDTTDYAAATVDVSGLEYIGPLPPTAGIYNTRVTDAGEIEQQIIVDANSPIVTNTGYYTLSFFGQTTAHILYNDITLDYISGIINASSEVAARGGVTLSANNSFGIIDQRTNGGFSFSLTWPAPVVSGGTYTLTLFGEYWTITSGLAWSASSSDIQEALNDLDDVTGAGGATVSNYSRTDSRLEFDIVLPPPAFDGGIYRFSFGDDESGDIPCDADIADLQEQIDALVEHVPYLDGAVVSGEGYNGSDRITFSVRLTAPPITGDASELTPSPISISSSYFDPSASTQLLQLLGESTTRSLYVPGHGFSADDLLYIFDGETYYGALQDWELIDEDHIELDAAESPFDTPLLIKEIGKRTRAAYAPGTQVVRCQLVTDFYLPGVTPGITTPEDIPLPTNQSDNDSMLLAIFGSGPFNFQVGQLSYYRGNILQQTTTVINANDL